MSSTLLDLMVKIGVQDDASSKIASVGSTVKSGLVGAAKTGAAAIGAAFTAAASGAVAIGKSALEAYASYEQLAGGVETLFGAGGATLEEYAAQEGKTVSEVESEYQSLMDAQNTVMANAASAYQTAGMSANDYMETVTSFSASLIQSLGGDTQTAAEYANTAITDMSDNANKMGTDIESLKTAYAAFAKQNYTLLDNLKLGYGGTKSEMERLIQDANDLRAANGETADLTIDSYADIVTAIHEVQTEMGITGTTAKEAATTIEGSVNSAKAAWENWLTGLGDDSADMSQLTDELVDSVITAASNIGPRLVQILGSAASTISEKLPEVIEQLKTGISDGSSGFAESASALIGALLNGLIELAPMLADGAVMLITQLSELIMENAASFTRAAVELVIQLANGLIEAMPTVLAALATLLVALVVAIGYKVGDFFNGAGELVASMASGLASGAGEVLSGIKSAIQGAIDYITSIPSQALQWGADIVSSIADGIWSAIGSITSAASNIASTISSFLHFSEPDVGPLSDFHTYMPDMMEQLASGIEDGRSKVRKAVGNVASDMSFGLSTSSAGTASKASGNTYVINGLDWTNDEKIEAAMLTIFGKMERLGAL